MRRPALFDDQAFYASLFTIAVPIMVQNLISALVNMADTVMIGRLGTVEIAAVGLGNQVFFLYMMILFGISSGGSVFTAQYWGKRDMEGIRRTTGLCLTIAMAVALAFTLACALIPGWIISRYSADPAVIAAGAVYLRWLSPAFVPFAVSFVFTLILRSVERVRVAMMTTLVALSLNVLLNYLLIFGIGPFPRLGVAGAAMGTAISRWVEVAVLVLVVYGKGYAPAGTRRELFGYDLAFVRRFFSIALPVMVNELVWALGITLQNVILARTDTEAIAAFNITNTVSQLTWVFFIGLGNAAGVLVGKRIGEGNDAAARDYARRITRVSPLFAAGIAFLLIPLSFLMPLVFHLEGGVIALVRQMFVMLAFSYPFRAFNMSMIIGVCRAGGDTRFTVVYDLAAMYFLSLPAAALASFVFGAPVWAVYLCIVGEEPFKMLLGLWRLRTGKWLHNVTI